MLLKLGIGWMFYYVLHSILATNWVKEKCLRHLPAIFPYYRILFNLIAMLGLLPLIYFSLMDTSFLWEQSSLLKISSIVLIAAGIAMLGIAFASFNVKEFIGFEKSEYAPDAKLITIGVYRYMRHPLYTAVLLLFPGIFLYRPTLSVLVLVVLTVLYVEIGSRLEEKKLIQVFGEDYIQYRKSVKRYFPFIY